MQADNKFGKTICSICYEDLKPIVEDLQVISICGHVFHELCLQQWFEYCSGTKKCTCPVCKQGCSAKNVSRLYFQSVGDQSDSVIPQKVKDRQAEDPGFLRGEVNRLEVKVSRLDSVLESQAKELQEVNEELCHCRERTREEVASKNEALRQKTSIQQLLHSKSQELDKLISEGLRLKERNMALAKELAAFKLVSDLNLEEDDILKFASLGNEANNKDTIDILRKSLVIRNRNYTELMAKCNLLGREKAHSCKKLEKAKGKINKLKTRVQELETAVEVKDNEALRYLKASKKTSRKRDILIGIDENANPLFTNSILSEGQMEQCSAPKDDLEWTRRGTADLSCSSKLENFKSVQNMDANHTKNAASTMACKKERNAMVNEDISRCYKATPLSSDSKHQADKDMGMRSPLPRLGAIASDNKDVEVNRHASLHGFLGLGAGISSDKGISPVVTMDEDVILIDDDSAPVQPTLNIRNEASSPFPLSKPGNVCFSGGLLGPDGTTRYLGKWCKRGQNNSTTKGGDLIAVGADGRGGRIKVLRSSNHSSLDGKENLSSAKRLKYGEKTSSLQSKGCLQIEHFFGRVSH
ncbi:hypothetical protein Ddye_017692 [Dipteronia dyeriana]|uniref:RING-type domain-containing protein n=1 Tax=Dipteronia dyeriana TaxID=168575 RepID=A0AAD9U9Q5_9ROSI|nr:hypothetical protein Ddye_017692 [Dipteronia dyeriana]